MYLKFGEIIHSDYHISFAKLVPKVKKKHPNFIKGLNTTESNKMYEAATCMKT